jgi:predicted 2-oxoglutarate/Fe(II)-dependent dioxygenase YbiX
LRLCKTTWECEYGHNYNNIGVKLNDNYEGALLDFPRQNFTNAQLPVGSLLAWPSLVTHPHGSTPITSGVKYSLTIWFELPISLS